MDDEADWGGVGGGWGEEGGEEFDDLEGGVGGEAVVEGLGSDGLVLLWSSFVVGGLGVAYAETCY